MFQNPVSFGTTSIIRIRVYAAFKPKLRWRENAELVPNKFIVLCANVSLCEIFGNNLNMESGIILINKNAGITSFDALREIKRALGTSKVGHTGTLDKFASGLLIVLAGKSLKLSQWFSHSDKKYKGRLLFGVETDTLDPEGKEIAAAAPPSREKAESVISQFTGSFMQEPPVFSAVHVNGKRASNLARSGIIPEMKKRPVTIYRLELLNWDPPYADIFVHCSSGTYIRSLARDIALEAGSRGYLESLVRTDIAGFTLDMTVNKHGDRRSGIGDREKGELIYEYGMRNEESNGISVLPIDKGVISRLGLPWLEVTAQETQAILHGKPLDQIMDKKSSNGSPVFAPHSIQHIFSSAVFCGETLIAVIEKVDGKWKYGCVLN